MPKNNIKFLNVLKNATKKRNIETLLTFQKNSIKFCKKFTQYRIFFTQTLFAFPSTRRLWIFLALKQNIYSGFLQLKPKFPVQQLPCMKTTLSYIDYNSFFLFALFLFVCLPFSFLTNQSSSRSLVVGWSVGLFVGLRGL